MRIISGNLKGRTLFAVKGRFTRPTSDRVREAVFNILGPAVEGAKVLDLFAGTGALGMEALSRGSDFAVFIDNSKGPVATIGKNLNALKLEMSARVISWDIVKNLNCIRKQRPGFNLVFMDPPYDRGLITPCFFHLAQSASLENNALIVVEHSPRENVPDTVDRFVLSDRRKYGKTLVSFFKYMIQT